VGAAHLGQGVKLVSTSGRLCRVGAEQGERILGAQLIPHRLDLDGGVDQAGIPEQRDHLTEDANRPPGLGRLPFLDPAGLQVIEVLLVEDDPGDVLMTTEAFELSPMHSTLHVVGDGEQALRFGRRTGEFTGAPRPGLILLDLNLPRRNGLEVLAELKADPDLLTIPVVIFSTSQAETDIAASYQLHANAYITKPVSLDLFTEAIRQVDDFFLTLVKLPG
jgi:CheY-like chemotaxis protein